MFTTLESGASGAPYDLPGPDTVAGLRRLLDIFQMMSAALFLAGWIHLLDRRLGTVGDRAAGR